MIAEMTTTVPERIDAIKTHLGITKDADLARLCEVSKQAIYGWKYEGKRPSEDAAYNLEQKVGIRAEFFRFGRGHMVAGAIPPEDLDRALIARMESVSEDEAKKLASDYMKIFAKYL